MKRVNLLVTFLIATPLLSFLFSHVHLFGDAHLHARQAEAAPLMERAHVPPEVRALLTSKCADCHSLQTRTPWYANFAPVSWLLERDIVEAREHMNLSQWENLSADDRQAFRAKIVQQTRSREMPPLQYRIIHWSARITDADVTALAAWARQPSADGAPAPAAVAPAAAADANQGKAVFQKRCTGCHALDQNREGPHLAGVYGRISGAVPQFAYSDALKKAHSVWSDKSLDQWLTDPDAFVPGNNMEFHVAKPQERRDLIEFLKQSAAR